MLDREWRTLRDRQRDLRIGLDRIARAPAGSAYMLVEIVALVSVPSASGQYFAAKVVDPGGAECEGCDPTFTDADGVIYVLVVGSSVPVAGDRLIACSVGGRWLADTSDGPHRGCCAASMDAVLPLVDAHFGSTSLVWDGTNKWLGCLTGSFLGSSSPCNSCPAGSVILQYILEMRNLSGLCFPQLTVKYSVSGGCFVLGSCGGGNAEITEPIAHLQSWNCPSAGTPFRAHFANGSGTPCLYSNGIPTTATVIDITVGGP